jgi:hypothetical protein
MWNPQTYENTNLDCENNPPEEYDPTIKNHPRL